MCPTVQHSCCPGSCFTKIWVEQPSVGHTTTIAVVGLHTLACLERVATLCRVQDTRFCSAQVRGFVLVRGITGVLLVH